MINWIWSKSTRIPHSGLAAWHQYEKGTVSSSLIPDFSGNSRPLSAVSNAPVLTDNIWNNQPAWLFNGSATNPLQWAATVQVRHIFLVMAFTEATLSGTYQGVLSGLNTYDALTGTGGTDKFYDFGLSERQYRKAGKYFALNNQKAPMAGVPAVIELISPTAMTLDGIQIGQQRNLTATRGKFYFFESLFYTDIKNDCERRELFAYFAERYHLWQKRADDINIFPFPFERPTAHVENELSEISEAEGGRAKDRVVRYLNDADEPIQTYNFNFNNRNQREYAASRAFLREHRLHLPFWVQDIERNQITKITRESSELNSTGTIYGRFNYGFTGKIYDYTAVTEQPLPIPEGIDSTDPSISFTSPASLAFIKGTVALVVSASDNVAVSRVEYYDGATLLGTNSVSPFGFNLNTTGFSDGNKTITAKVFDTTGNNTSVSRTFKIDNTAPTTPLMDAIEDATATTLNVSFLASSDANGVDHYIIRRSTNSSFTTYTDQNFAAAGETPGSSITKTITGLSSSTLYYVYVLAVDAAGNISSHDTAISGTTDAAAGGIALVAHTEKASYDNGTSTAIDTTGATLLVIALSRYQGGTGISVTDSKGNTWAPLTLYGITGDQTIRFWCCKNPVVGTGHTFTVSGTSLYSSFAAAAFSGTDTTANADGENGNTSTSGSTIQTGSLTPSVNGCLLLTAVATKDTGLSVDSSFTIIGTVNFAGGANYGVSLAYLIETTAAAKNPTWTQSGATSLAATIAAFKPA